MTIIDSQGDTVRVYKFQLYDVVRDEMITSTRMARQETIDRIHAVKFGPAYLVPHSDVDDDGLTAKNYIPVQGA
jgi:hypothetical protein